MSTNLLTRSLSRFSPSPLQTVIIRSRTSIRSQSTIVTPVTPVIPVRKPVGAFRGGLLGFFLGTTLAGSALYYHVIEEYKLSNELLTQDIYTLQNTVQKVEIHMRNLEERAGVKRGSNSRNNILGMVKQKGSGEEIDIAGGGEAEERS